MVSTDDNYLTNELEYISTQWILGKLIYFRSFQVYSDTVNYILQEEKVISLYFFLTGRTIKNLSKIKLNFENNF